jgi:hypothetical protein
VRLQEKKDFQQALNHLPELVATIKVCLIGGPVPVLISSSFKGLQLFLIMRLTDSTRLEIQCRGQKKAMKALSRERELSSHEKKR